MTYRMNFSAFAQCMARIVVSSTMCFSRHFNWHFGRRRRCRHVCACILIRAYLWYSSEKTCNKEICRRSMHLAAFHKELFCRIEALGVAGLFHLINVIFSDI